MSRRLVALLAAIGLVPILIALTVAGCDVYAELGNNVRAEGAVVTADEGAGPRFHVVALVDEAEATAVAAGTRADVRLPALGIELAGTVRQVLPPEAAGQAVPSGVAQLAGAVAGRSRLPVWLDIDYGDAPLVAGMKASITIHRQ